MQVVLLSVAGLPLTLTVTTIFDWSPVAAVVGAVGGALGAVLRRPAGSREA